MKESKTIKVAVGGDLSIEDFTKIKITGALNADLYSRKSDKEIEDFLHKDVLTKTAKFVSADWLEDVTAEAEYVVIDYKYNPVKEIKREFTFTFNELDKRRKEYEIERQKAGVHA